MNKKLLLTTAIVTSFALFSPAQAQTVTTIIDGQTESVQQVLGADDTLIIENGGTLSTGAADAVDASNIADTNITVENAGTITTSGSSAYGVVSGGANATIINSGSITTSGNSATGVVSISTGANDTITNNGTIITSGDFAEGIWSNGANDTITNSGRITTGGISAEGILSTGADAIITNSGTIITSGSFSAGNGADGISSTGANAIITNSGSIITSGDLGLGISSSNANDTIINSGSITTNGNSAVGILLFSNAAVTNSGSIITNGDNADGIFSIGADATIANSGAITTSGDNADGISATEANAVITNSGSISVTGTGGSTAVSLDAAGADNSSFTNSGLISATGSATQAIAGGTGQQTLNLEQGSMIIGTVDLGGGVDTVNVNVNGNGPSGTVTFLNTETINLASGVAGVVVGNRVTTVDPTGQSFLGTTVNAVNVGIHNTINARVNAAFSSAAGISSEDPVAIEPAAGGSARSRLFDDGAEVWGEVFGGRLEREGEGATLAFDQNYYGFVSGYERQADFGRFGFTFGFANSVIETTQVQSVDTDVLSFFGGVYGHTGIAPNLTLSTNLILGYENYDNRRTVIDNIAGVESAESDFNNFFISPSVSLQYDHELVKGFHLRSSGSLVYTASFFDSYSESGTTASNLDIDSRTVQTLNTRAQIAGVVVRDNVDFELRVGFDGRFSDNGDINASLAGNSFQFSSSDDDSVLGGFIGMNANIAASDQLNIVADAEFRKASGSENEISGRLRAVHRF